MTKALIVIGFVFTMLAMGAGIVYAIVMHSADAGIASVAVGAFAAGILISAAHEIEFGGDEEEDEK